jgi:hypothetical protein
MSGLGLLGGKASSVGVEEHQIWSRCARAHVDKAARVEF